MSSTALIEPTTKRPTWRIETLESRFDQLKAEWKAASEFLSQSGKMAMLPSYQQIIGLGPDAVPLIVAELKREPDHWFWALEAITGENPVLPKNRENVLGMTSDWLTWARERGIQ